MHNALSAVWQGKRMQAKMAGFICSKEAYCRTSAKPLPTPPTILDQIILDNLIPKPIMIEHANESQLVLLESIEAFQTDL